MNDLFRDMITERWLIIYMNDLFIAFSDSKTHTEWTCHVLQQMTELDLHLKLEKCQFNVPKVEYLRMIIKPGQLTMDLVNLNGIAAWPTSTKVKDVQWLKKLSTCVPVLHWIIPTQITSNPYPNIWVYEMKYSFLTLYPSKNWKIWIRFEWMASISKWCVMRTVVWLYKNPTI